MKTRTKAETLCLWMITQWLSTFNQRKQHTIYPTDALNLSVFRYIGNTQAPWAFFKFVYGYLGLDHESLAMNEYRKVLSDEQGTWMDLANEIVSISNRIQHSTENHLYPVSDNGAAWYKFPIPMEGYFKVYPWWLNDEMLLLLCNNGMLDVSYLLKNDSEDIRLTEK